MPVYDWDAITGKQYSLLFVELMRPGVPRGIVVHYFAYNVRNGTAVTKDLQTTLGGWRAPAHGWVGSAGLYVHLLFEHNTDLAVNMSAAMRIGGSCRGRSNGVHGIGGARQCDTRLFELDGSARLDPLAHINGRG